jgi:hypothetical protein
MILRLPKLPPRARCAHVVLTRIPRSCAGSLKLTNVKSIKPMESARWQRSSDRWYPRNGYNLLMVEPIKPFPVQQTGEGKMAGSERPSLAQAIAREEVAARRKGGRAKVTRIAPNPTLTARGPSETFFLKCDPPHISASDSG